MDNLIGRHFISLFLTILFSLWLLSQRTARDKELRYFWLTLVSVFLLVFQDIAESITSQDPDLRFWRTLLSIAGYMLRSTAAIGLVLVVCKPEQRTRALWIPCAVNLLVCCTAFFTDIAFGFDEKYRFYRGPLGYVAFVVPFLYLAMILWMTFKRYGNSDKKAYGVILVLCAALCFVAAILDATHGGVRLNETIIACSIFFYMYLRSYDIRRDSLTGLLNRQSMYDDCSVLGTKICAAASIDMNGLKVMNNADGNRAGDEALSRIGSLLQNAGSDDIRAYRIGGDEFVMLFVGQDEAGIRKILQKIREEAGKAGYSVSCGYAMRAEKEDTESLIRRSDMKMFEQKAQFYRERAHDRRRVTTEEEPGSDTAEIRRSVENLPFPAAVYRFADHQAETLAVSDGYCRMFGSAERDLYGEIHADDRERFSGATLRFSDGQEDLDVVFRTSAGMKSNYKVVHARGTLLHTESHERIAYVWYMDEGEYIEGNEEAGSQINRALNSALHEESILHATHYDALTGLPNLAWFFQLFEAEKGRILSSGRQGDLLYIDLNGMKYFNQRYGFAEGDKLLKAFAEALTGIFGRDCSCHIGADRFAACAPEDRRDDLLQQLFTQARQMNDGKTLPVRVGIHSTSMESVPVSSAYDRAKMACDAIRKSDVSSSFLYNTALREEARRNQYLAENIDRAVAERWIKVYYQPIVRAVNEKVCDEEALARWIDPVEGFLSPAEFIPQLEKAGLIYKLDLCVLDQVLEKINEQKEAGLHPVPHSINLSRSDFDACDIVEEIRKRVDDAGISRSMIAVEITESVIGSDFEFMKEQVNRFRELGFPVWMDDFGSGYSSLDVLQSIRFDLLKFDMSFMRKLDEGESGKIILTELMKMATTLGLDTVCEGVETEQHVRFLQVIGCSKLQGYYFSKPLSMEQLRERIAGGLQFGFETPESSSYYETIGRVNLYDLGVLASLEEDPFQYTFDTLPMGILEIKGTQARFVRANPSYREFVRRFFGMDTNELSKDYASFNAAFIDNIIRTCCEQGNRALFNEKMQDGSVVHSFARRIAVNPVNGNQAVAIAVLSISDPNEEESYAEIAGALAADYYNIYVVDLDNEAFVEYRTSVGGNELAEERRGTGFFPTIREEAETRIYEEDREFFLRWFTRGNVIRELDEEGVFMMTCRLMDTGTPMYVNMKITRLQGTNRIILGVSIIDSQMKQQAKIEGTVRERDALARVMAIAEDYLTLYSVDPDTGSYVEYTATEDYESLGFAKEGDDFFRQGIADGRRVVFGEDLPKYLEGFTRENVLKAIRETGRFTLSYRLVIREEPVYVSLKIAPFQTGTGEKLLAGVRKWRIRH